MSQKAVYIVDAKRTPQAKSGAELKDVAAPFFASGLIRELLDHTALPQDKIDEVIIEDFDRTIFYR